MICHQEISFTIVIWHAYYINVYISPIKLSSNLWSCLWDNPNLVEKIFNLANLHMQIIHNCKMACRLHQCIFDSNLLSFNSHNNYKIFKLHHASWNVLVRINSQNKLFDQVDGIWTHNNINIATLAACRGEEVFMWGTIIHIL